MCTHDGGCPQAAEPKHSHFKGGIDVSSAIPPSIRLPEELLFLLANSRKWYHQILQKVQSLVPHDCIQSCTVCTVVQQYLYVLVDYCCFHLTSGASTATVGPYVVHRNRKRFLLSQPTLREEFVEKKYQMFDIIGLLMILA